ncbi:MAG: CAP domain-containing protein [Legionella sp.]|nr:CAP domain-containing protein [Legionella sp.]
MIIKKFLHLLCFLCLSQILWAEQPLENKLNDEQIQNAVLVHINEYRAKHHLSPLTMDARLVQEAKNHSLDMAKHSIPFGHTYFNDRIKRLRTQIKSAGAGAENVAYNYKDANEVVKNWLLSPGHKTNIDGHYNLTGVGIARDERGKLYYTQIFMQTGASQTKIVQGSLHPFVTLPFFGRKH